MVKYTSAKQLSFTEFQTPFVKGLDGKNRWVRLARQIPWDELVTIYSRSLRLDFGRGAIDPRVVIGAMIIKHLKCLSDEATITEIQENPYLQFFLGFQEFRHQPVFDSSLFVTLRRRLGVDAFEDMNQQLLAKIENKKQKNNRSASSYINNSVKSSESSNNSPSDAPTAATTTAVPPPNAPAAAPVTNQGTLILDATVAPQDIKFPTDLDLLNTSREQTERIIDELYVPAPGQRKPRTYRRQARQDYLATARKKRKKAKEIRKALRKQLNYVNRNINTIQQLLAPNFQAISYKSLRQLWIIQEVYRQQHEMYTQRRHQIEGRIVSLSQPHVRPIVRGKAGKAVEFGAKLTVSLVNGFAHLDRLSWEPYNEGGDLKMQVENYHRRYGVYPEVVLADRIFGTQENRAFLKKHGIRFSGKALGRPPQLSPAEKRKIAHEARRRSLIEGKFGEGKRRYDLDLVKAKTSKTSESWIAIIFFVMNLALWGRIYFFAKFLWRFCVAFANNFKELFGRFHLPIRKLAFLR